MDEKALLDAIKAIVREENRTMQDDLASLKKDVAKLNHGLNPKLDKVLEMVSSTNDRNRQLDLVTDKVEDHEHRLFAIEESLKEA